MALNRLQMEEVINDGGVVLWLGERLYTIAELPTQEEIDAVYAGSSNTAIVVGLDNLTERFPNSLDSDGGLKVHLQNPEDISGGGGSGDGLTNAELRSEPLEIESAQLPTSLVDGGLGVTILNPEDISGGGGSGGGLTDTQLRATPVPVSTGGLTNAELRATKVPVSVPDGLSVTNFPAVQPVSDNGGSLTVDGSVSVGNFPASYPSTVADGADLSLGAKADAEVTGNGSLIAITKRVRTIIGSVVTLLGAGLPSTFGTGGGVQVDVVSGGGGLPFPAIVEALPAASRTATVTTADLTNLGYKGIKVYYSCTAASANGASIIVEELRPDGGYSTLINTNAITTVSTGTLLLYPGGLTTATGNNPVTNGLLGKTYRIRLFYGSAVASTFQVWYQLYN